LGGERREEGKRVNYLSERNLILEERGDAELNCEGGTSLRREREHREGMERDKIERNLPKRKNPFTN